MRPITSFDYVENKFQFFCGECLEIVKPAMLKRHLSTKHGIQVKDAEPTYLDAMMDVYYHVITSISTFKKSATYKELKEQLGKK